MDPVERDICDMANHVIRRVARRDDLHRRGHRHARLPGDGGRPARGTQRTLRDPVDPTGNMYFVEMQNHVVRRVSAKDGNNLTVAGVGKEGFGGDGGRRRRRFSSSRTAFN